MGKTVGGVEAWAVILRRKQNRRLFREICQVVAQASSSLTYSIHNYCNTIILILSRTFLALSENFFKRPRNLSKVA